MTLSRARIIGKGNGIWAYDTKGVQLTVRDSVFEQTDPGAVVDHRAVRANEPKSFVFENNRMTDVDGILIHGLTTAPIDPLIVRFNEAINVGRYPHPTEGNCCVTFFQLDHAVAPNGMIHWNKTRNVQDSRASRTTSISTPRAALMRRTVSMSGGI